MDPLDQHRLVHHAIRSTEVPPHLRYTFASNTPVMKGGWTILLLILSNTFMTFAWCGHLRFKEFEWSRGLGLFATILISWGVAFSENSLMVPANRPGHVSNGGHFNLVQCKVIQKVITLVVFAIFTTQVFLNEVLRWQHGLVFKK